MLDLKAVLYQFPYGKIYEDVGTTYKTFLKANRVVYSSVPKYYYVQNSKSITKSESFNNRELNRIEMANNMCDDIEEKIKDYDLYNLLEIFRCSQHVAVVNVMIKSKCVDKGILNNTKKIIKDRKKIILNYGTKKQKYQYLLLLYNYPIYKLIFKLKNK